MTYIKINETIYPATINGRNPDRDWDNRHSKSITLEMDHDTALATFVDELDWSIVYQPISYIEPGTGKTITPEPETYDNSEFCVAGPITDNRNGTVTVKMGTKTAEEQLTELMEVIGNE